MDSDKACGPDGISPGVFKSLPMNWVMFITALFNAVFTSATYPVNWSTAKFFTIFKKGNRQMVRNCRGIYVLNSKPSCMIPFYVQGYRVGLSRIESKQDLKKDEGV